MIVNLDDLKINASAETKRCWHNNGRDWECYRVEGFLYEERVAVMSITRALNCKEERGDGFFFDLSKNLVLPKPFISYKETIESLRGNGICGKLILLANDFYKGKLGTNIYSNTHFLEDFFYESKRVWQKLEENGLAVFEPHVLESGEKQDRWFIV